MWGIEIDWKKWFKRCIGSVLNDFKNLRYKIIILIRLDLLFFYIYIYYDYIIIKLKNIFLR